MLPWTQFVWRSISTECVVLKCHIESNSYKYQGNDDLFIYLFILLPTFRPLLEIFVLILGPHRVLRLIVWKIILPLWATHQRETVHCIRFCWWPPGGAMALQITTDHYCLACTYCTTSVLWEWGESWLLCQTITLNVECTQGCDGLWNLYTLTGNSLMKCGNQDLDATLKSTTTGYLSLQWPRNCWIMKQKCFKTQWEDYIHAWDTREL